MEEVNNSINSTLSNLTQLATPSEDANALINFATQYDVSGDSAPYSTTGVDLLSLVDPRKVAIATQMGIYDGLNEVEKDFATKPLIENIHKYGQVAKEVDNTIGATANRDTLLSLRERNPARAITDTALSGLNGAAQGILGTLEAVNVLNPVTNIIDSVTGSNIKGGISSGLNTLSQLAQNITDAGTSDVVLHDRLLRGYKTQLEENLHAREEQEAVARGESPLTAMLTRITKDIGSGVSNATSTSVGLTDSIANTMGSVLGTSLTTMGAGAAVRRATALGSKLATAGAGVKTALTDARDLIAKQVAANASKNTISGIRGSAQQAGLGINTQAGTTATNAAEQLATSATGSIGKTIATNASKGALEAAKDSRPLLERIATNPMTQVGLQEGGVAGLQAYDAVQSMSDEELMASSEQYRKFKQDYLAQGYSEEEAQLRAKEDVANSASTRSTAYAAAIAAPMGKFLHKATIKNPLGQFVDVNFRKAAGETAEESLENLSQFGSNLAAKQTYNNDQDMAEGVGVGIGESAASAGIGTFTMGAPSMAKRQIKNAFKKTTNAVLNKAEDISTNKKINTLKESSADIDSAINSIKSEGTTATTGTTAGTVSPDATNVSGSTATNTAFSDPDNLNTKVETTVKPQDKNVDATNGNLSTKAGAKDSLQKIKEVTTSTVGEEGAKEYNKVLGGDAIKPSTTKFQTFLALTANVDGLLNTPNLTEDAKLHTLRIVDSLEKLHNDLFQAQPIENITAQISDDKAKQAVIKAHKNYTELGANKKYQNAVKTAVRFAKEQASANSDFDKILADNSLTDEQKDQAITKTVEAYKFLVKNKIANDAELNKAKEIAKNIKDDDERVFFLKEINEQEQLRANIAQNDFEQKEFASQLDNLIARYSKDKDFTKENSHKKSMLEVSVEKLRTLYNPAATNRKSFASMNLQILARMTEGDVEGARQLMYNHMNFIQSQINKFNAWRKSKADSIVANQGITDASKRVMAKPETYATYNPKTHEWRTSDQGMHGGSIELGAIMLKESEILKDQFNALKALYFKNDPNLNLVENSNSTVTDDYIKKEYAKYLKHSGKEDVLKLLDTTPELDRNAPKQESASQNQTKATFANTNENQSTGSVNAQSTGSKPANFDPTTAFDTKKIHTPVKGDITSFHGENNKPGFLSNFYDSPVTYKGRTYNNVESAFQAAKSADEGTKDMFTDMAGAEAKKFGRKVKLRSDWESTDNNGVPTKVKVMGNILREKFKNPELRKQLLATGDAQLIEGNNWKDTYWGAVQNQSGEYVGANVLGQLLQQIRSEIRNEEAKPQQKQTESSVNNSDETQAQQSSTNTNAQRREAIFNEIKQEKAASKQKVVNANESIRSVFANAATNNTASKEADVSYKNSILTKIKNKLFGLTTKDKNTSNTSYLQDMQTKLGNIINTTNVNHVGELTVEDAGALFNAIDNDDPKSPISQFFGSLTQRLLPSNENCLINTKKDYTIGLSENSVLVQNNLVTVTGRESSPYTITYPQAVDIFENHPEVIEELSDAELSAIYNMFPTLSLLELGIDPNTGKYKMQLNQEIAAKLFLSSIAFWNQKQFTGSQDWERLAETFNFNLMDVVNHHDKDGNPTGIQFMEQLASGMTTEGIVRGLTADLKNVLGVKFDQDNVSYETSNTFFRILAGSIVSCLHDNKIIQEFSKKDVAKGMHVYSLARNPDDNKVTPTIFSSLKNPEGLDKILGTARADDTGAIYVSGSPEASQIEKSTRNTYEHSNVELPKNVREARDIIEETEYFLDENMLGIYEGLGEEGLVELYGQGKLDSATMDLADATAKKGKNLVITGAWEALQKWSNQMKEVAKEANVPVSKICKRFKLGITTVNRIQELEAYGPIANKLTREVLSATWGEVKVKGAKPKDQVQLARAVMQNFGAKLNKNNKDRTVGAFKELLSAIKKDKTKFSNLLTLAEGKGIKVDTVKNAMNEINTFLAQGDNGKVTKNIKALGLDSIDKSFMSLHAMQTLAMYANASMAKNKPDTIRVNLYCEADGTTNGSANGNMLYTGDLYDPETLALSTYFLESLDMANMRVGDHSGKSAGEVKEKTPKGQRDLYEYSGAVAEKGIKQALDTYAEGPNSTWTVEKKQRGDMSVDSLIKSVSNFFQLSAVTDNIFTPLQKAISRNFMKDPCTKGGYGAGKGSINNTLLSPLIGGLHEMRSRILKAETNAKKQKRAVTKREIAIAAFGDMYDGYTKKHPNADMSSLITAEEQQKYKEATLKEAVCMKMFEGYLTTLNALAQNKLIIRKNEEKRTIKMTTFSFAPSTNTFNTTKVTKQGRYGNYTKTVLKPITYKSFLKNQGGDPDAASISFDQETLDNIRDNVQKIYGDPIFESIQKAIRSNISSSQETMQNVSAIATLMNNIIRLARVSTLPKGASIRTVKSKFNSFNNTGSVLSNIFDFGSTRVSVADSERLSEGALKGGSVYNIEQFTQYEGTTDSKYSFADPGFSSQTYDMYANPGVRALPNTTISLGDATMMINFANRFLKKLGNKATLIFDGLNAPIGMQEEYGKAINQVQYETDQVNPLETFLDKVHDLLTLTKDPKSKKELIKAYQLIADAMNLKEGAYTEAGVNAYISLYFQTDTFTQKFNDRVRDLCWALNSNLYSPGEETARDNHLYDVFTPSMFTPQNADCLTLRKASRDLVRQEILKKYGNNPKFKENGWDVAIQTAIDKNNAKLGPKEKDICAYLVKTGYLKAPTKTLKSGEPDYRSALVGKQRDVLKHALNAFTQGKDIIAVPAEPVINIIGQPVIPNADTTESVEHLVMAALEGAFSGCLEKSQGISRIKTAVYLMGGTYDHMASLDTPYVALPSKSEFKSILDKFHLVLKDGITADNLWDMLMEGDDSPNTALEKLNERVNEHNTRTTIWSSPAIVKARTEILQQMVDTIKANTIYTPEFTAKKIPSEDFAQKSYAPNTKTTSVKEILSSETVPISTRNRLNMFVETYNEGKPLHTKLHTFTGKTPTDAANALKAKYSDDIAKANERIAKQNQENTKWNDEHKDAIASGKMYAKPIQKSITTDSVFAVVDKYIDNGGKNGVQFYDEATDAIYTIPTTSSGIETKAEESRTRSERFPHEIFHALANKALSYVGKLLDEGKTPKYFTDLAGEVKHKYRDEAKGLSKAAYYSRQAVALKAYNRLASLKQQVDTLLPDDVSNLPDECFQLKGYILNVKNNDKMSEGAKIKEFAAYFGTMSQQELDHVLTGLSADSKEITSLRDLAKDTQKDASILQKLITAVKTAFADFIAKIFGSDSNSTLVQDIIHGNVLILNTVQTANNLQKKAEAEAKLNMDVPANTDTTASFLKESSDTSFDPEVDVSGEGIATPRAQASNGVVQDATLQDLSNSLINAVENIFANSERIFKQNGSIQSGVELTKKVRQLIALEKRLAPQNGKDFSVYEDVITPLKNYGFQLEDEKAFANVINILSYMKAIKAPFYSDVVLATKHIMNQLTPEDFCTDIHDQAQMSKGANIVKFLQGIDKGSLAPDMITPVIFALSQSDPAFKKILSKMKISKSNKNNDYLYIDKIFNKAANKAITALDNLRKVPTGSNQQEQLTNLLGRMARDERDFSKGNFVQDWIAKAESLISNGMTTIAKATANKFNVKYEGIKNLPTYIENSLNNNKYVPHFITEGIHDVLGSTEQNYEFYSWNRKAKNSIQQNRQQAIEKTPIAIKEMFNESPTDEQWSRFTRTIGKSSLSTLYRGDTAELAKILEDNASYRQAIDEAKRTLSDTYRIGKCAQLASYMMTGKAGKMLLRNPEAIANRLGSQFGYKASDTEVKACDRLTSLYAIGHLTKEEKAELVSMLRSEPEGMRKLLNMAKSQQALGAKKASGSNKGKYNWYKGYVTNQYQNAKHFKVARMSDQKDMERMGYKLVREYKGSNLDGAKLGIYYTKFNHTNPFNPGALTFTVATANGVTLGGSSLQPNAGMIVDPTIVKHITKNMGNYASANNEDLLPVFNADGTIVAYERTLDPTLLNDEQYLSPRTDFAELLGIQEGRNTEESMINEFNTGIIDHLVDKYKKASTAEKEAYVDLYSIEDPVVRSVVGMFPSDLRAYIAQKTGSEEFMVLRSEINDIIGYHSASITDSWTGESRIPKAVQDVIVKSCELVLGKNAFTYLKVAENVERSLVKTAKNNIIIRSIAVPTINMAANMIQLVNEGVPIQTIAKYTPQVIKELNQYVRFTTELLKIRQELNGETTGYRKHQLQAQEAVLVSGLNNLSIGYLLQQKEFSAIADLGNNNRDLDLTEGSIGDKILAQIDKLSENELVRSITHYGFLAPDTSLYKMLEKANQYGDFLGKAILYKDLTDRRGLTPEEAHKIVADEFVDYVRLPGRGRDFLERAGLLWFYNFKLRMAKVAVRNLKEHPLMSLALTMGGLPTPTADSILGKLPVLNYTIGPGMLMSAFCSTPFTALFALLF